MLPLIFVVVFVNQSSEFKQLTTGNLYQYPLINSSHVIEEWVEPLEVIFDCLQYSEVDPPLCSTICEGCTPVAQLLI